VSHFAAAKTSSFGKASLSLREGLLAFYLD